MNSDLYILCLNGIFTLPQHPPCISYVKCYKRMTMLCKSSEEISPSLVRSFGHSSCKRKHFNWDLGDLYNFNSTVKHRRETKSIN